MKTKFFKKLSFVLAVAMVLSVLYPAAGAFAAKKPKLNATSKYLHLDVEGKNEYDFNISNKQKGWKYDWESADEDVVVVDNKGVVTATGVGKTKVTVYITDKDGEEVAKLSAKVTVRDNIKEVKISNPPEGKLAVGQEYDFNRSFVTVSGSTKKTSAITRWTVEPSDTATIDDSGVFKATKAGKYTITARSFQSKEKYEYWLSDNEAYKDYVLATDSVEVTVAASMVEAKQVDSYTVKVTFDSEMEDVKDKFNVYQVVGTAKVKQLVKEAKLDDTKKVATIDMYLPFVQGATYVIEYPEMDDVSFVAATQKVEDVAAVKIATTKAVLYETTKIDVRLLNADGVDITNDELTARVTLDAEDVAGAYVDKDNKTVVFFEKDKSVKVTATFHTYEYDEKGNEVGNLSASGVIVGVEKDATSLTGLKAWTIADKTKKPDFSDVNHKISADDEDLRLFVEFNTKTGSKDDDPVNSYDNYLNFGFESSDENILIIADNGELYPVKAGTVVVVIKYAADTADNKVPVGTVQITIGAAAKAQNLVVTPSSFSLTDAAAVDDSKTVSLKVTDQLGRDIDINNIELKKLSGPANSNELDYTPNIADKKVTFKGKNAVPGVYTYQITVTDKNDNKITRTVVITIQDSKNAAAEKYVLELSDTTIDVKAADKKLNKGVSIQLYGINKGIKVTKETFDSSEFKLSIEAPESEWSGDQSKLNAKGEYVVLTTSGSAIKKAPTGTYKVSAYHYKEVSQGKYDWVLIDFKYFVVEDTQSKPALTKVKTQVVDDLSNLVDVVKECFEIKLDGEVLTDIKGVDATGTANSVNIRSVTVRKHYAIDDSQKAYIDFKVDIGITVKKK